ncbi:MAG: Octanoate-[acyl-carrier-protein]-protein-N-octanoyltransferase [uncultured Chloroflexia bacterium]|uniref:Octanoyltransferase n=1 Tax=uncultured Chloroflexia bacterium TaxID=1672391 RepID=A0A6J4IUU0_9CHLR|nr:MAG: Octanoate-[acyl-carrier-protein]-protein-N-octanoyltransferase [uncultured Chloroflexia bacterium]
MSLATQRLTVVDLGLVPYEEAWDRQRRMAAQRAAGEIGDTLLLLEHPHTYTFGSSGKREHLLVPEAELRAQGVAILDVDRGGDVTYHGPGQLVGYPILRLRDYGINVVPYLRCLEEVLIRLAAAYGLAAARQRGYTGVWVADEKLAAIGTKVDTNGITRHGFALNVSTDLRRFETIVPCGIRDRGVCSLESLLGRPVARAEAVARTAQAFEDVFDPAVAPLVATPRERRND